MENTDVDFFLCDRVNMRAHHFVQFIEIFLSFRNGNPGGGVSGGANDMMWQRRPELGGW
jgi:hypothetical protein